MFYALFLGDCCLGKQCYKYCKYKYDHSSADIRIGDLWGKTYKDNEDGVSAAIAFTKKGDEILNACNCELTEHPFDVVAEGQIKESLRFPGVWWRVLMGCAKSGAVPMRVLAFVNRVIGKLRKIIK